MTRPRSFLVLSILLCACGFKQEQADLVVHNALIHAVDEGNSMHQAMAIRDGRIVELGPERQIMNKYSAGQVLDAAGRHVYPGFIDGHCHFLG